MIKLHVVQAEFGDCFILESKSGKDSVNVLIDGGHYQTFEKHLRPTLQKIPSNGKLDLMVLSHIDNDHIMGLLDLLAEIKNQKEVRLLLKHTIIQGQPTIFSKKSSIVIQ